MVTIFLDIRESLTIVKHNTDVRCNVKLNVYYVTRICKGMLNKY